MPGAPVIPWSVALLWLACLACPWVLLGLLLLGFRLYSERASSAGLVFLALALAAHGGAMGLATMKWGHSLGRESTLASAALYVGGQLFLPISACYLKDGSRFAVMVAWAILLLPGVLFGMLMPGEFFR